MQTPRIGLTNRRAVVSLEVMNGTAWPRGSCVAKRTSNRVRRFSATLAVIVVGIGGVAMPRDAHADAYGISHPGRHIDYTFELEPEVILGFGRPFRDGPGLGVRGSIPIVFNGFVTSINNSVAITFGFDKDPFLEGQDYYLPVALQWNFWLHRNFSVFGEPGILVSFTDKAHFDPQIWGGGRVHFGEYFALTGRISVPTSPGLGVGLSFFF